MRPLLLLCVVLAPGCGGESSKTGTPGPVGQPWDGAAAYRALKTSGPASYRSDVAAIQAAIAAGPATPGTRTEAIVDDGQTAARVKLDWSTVKVGERHVCASRRSGRSASSWSAA